jgi:hypothetical protein
MSAFFPYHEHLTAEIVEDAGPTFVLCVLGVLRGEKLCAGEGLWN